MYTPLLSWTNKRWTLFLIEVIRFVSFMTANHLSVQQSIFDFHFRHRIQHILVFSKPKHISMNIEKNFLTVQCAHIVTVFILHQPHFLPLTPPSVHQSTPAVPPSHCVLHLSCKLGGRAEGRPIQWTSYFCVAFLNTLPNTQTPNTATCSTHGRPKCKSLSLEKVRHAVLKLWGNWNSSFHLTACEKDRGKSEKHQQKANPSGLT